jgi:hypothetical protein
MDEKRGAVHCKRAETLELWLIKLDTLSSMPHSPDHPSNTYNPFIDFPSNIHATSSVLDNLTNMQNTGTPRPESVREIERASRHRTQDAFNDLKRLLLERVPRPILQQLLATADTQSVLPRHGLSHAQAIKIACVIIQYDFIICTEHV